MAYLAPFDIFDTDPYVIYPSEADFYFNKDN